MVESMGVKMAEWLVASLEAMKVESWADKMVDLMVE
jgi:hypothetical protein